MHEIVSEESRKTNLVFVFSWRAFFDSCSNHAQSVSSSSHFKRLRSLISSIMSCCSCRVCPAKPYLTQALSHYSPPRSFYCTSFHHLSNTQSFRFLLVRLCSPAATSSLLLLLSTLSTVLRSTVTFFGPDAVLGPQVRYRIVQLQNFLLCVITNLNSRHV